MTTVDLRANALSPAYPELGLWRKYIMAGPVNVPALIASGTLASTGLAASTYYKVFSLPKYSIVLGAWIFVRTVDAGGATVDIVDSTASPVTYCGALPINAAGAIIDDTPYSWDIAHITAYNTGAGTDWLGIYVNSTTITTAIFDVCAEVISGKFEYSAGSSGTGQ